MNRTSRKAFDPTLQDFHKRNASVLEGDKITCMTAHRIKDAESPKRSQTKGVFDTLMMPRNHLSLPTKDQSSVIPIRKPSNRKDYFVFGLSERACFTESISNLMQIKQKTTAIFYGKSTIQMVCSSALLKIFKEMDTNTMLGKAITLV